MRFSSLEYLFKGYSRSIDVPTSECSNLTPSQFEVWGKYPVEVEEL
jgi:hypothetical protein